MVSFSLGSKRVFFVLREKFDTVQAVLSADPATVSKQMIKWCGTLACESLLLIEAEVAKPLELVKSCSMQDVELKLLTVFQESASEPRLPFTLDDASQVEGEEGPRVNLDTRLDNRIIDLRVRGTVWPEKVQGLTCNFADDGQPGDLPNSGRCRTLVPRISRRS